MHRTIKPRPHLAQQRQKWSKMVNLSRSHLRRWRSVALGGPLQRASEGAVQADLARTYGVSQATISRLAAPGPFGVSEVGVGA
jgi:hypothetical protein